jgi:hypothetical protein
MGYGIVGLDIGVGDAGGDLACAAIAALLDSGQLGVGRR